jgi:glyoxylase-like metal-dependent hydrolase (beta-lactamase superfamily II)
VALRIESALHDVRRAVGEVTAILPTHKHPDHTGGVAELRRRPGARGDPTHTSCSKVGIDKVRPWTADV